IDTTHRTVAPPAASTSKVDTTLGHDYTFLPHELFIVNGAYVPGKDPKDKPYQGVWIDLQPDGTYKYGRHKQTLYTGTWAYNHSVTTLLLKPDGKKDKNSEWHVQFNDQMMVWVGTRTFGDNGIQLQLLRRTELPD
ncbi:MAG TPA: hypothetical protein VJ508_13620, partial [Saprospiraceae bacterium]|nr:hypothetical protein [Saprospiraceae bacterium]